MHQYLHNECLQLTHFYNRNIGEPIIKMLVIAEFYN